MNSKIVLASFVAALSGFAVLPNTAKADADFRINLNIGAPRPPVIVVPSRGHDAPVYGYDRGYDSRDRRDHGPRGYWKEITVKTWVPARWVVTCDRRGREHRVLENGYFTYRTDRVWVANDYGYGRR